MVEDVGTLLVRTVVELGLEGHGCGGAFHEVDLLDAALRTEKEVLETLVGIHVSTSHILHHERGFLLAQVVFPEVHTSLEGCLVVQGVALEHSVAHTG